jgi:uncharacterized iron-regulated membrane protein
MFLRKIVFWVHLACGVTAGSVILVMSVTGVLLTYQKQLTQWSDRAYWTTPVIQGRSAPMSVIVANAEGHAQGARVSSVVLHSDPVGPVAASLDDGRTLYLDPSTGVVRGENTAGVRAFMSGAVRLHRWLGASGEARAPARAITGWSNLVFLFLVMSGLYLWVPRRWTLHHVRRAAVLNTRARGKARDFNWHHVFGFWMAIPLAIVVGSATVISFPWASDLAYRVAGDDPPERVTQARPAPSRSPSSAPAPSPPVGGGAAGVLAAAPARAESLEAMEVTPIAFETSLLDAVVPVALSNVGEWRTISVSMPADARTPVRMRVYGGGLGEPQKRHTLEFDAVTGEQTLSEAFSDQSRGRRFRTFLRFAHTGEYFGIWGQTVAGFASLAGVLLVWSGLALAWRRLILQPLRRRVRLRA